MKKYSKYLLAAMCVVALAFSAGAFIKVNAASATVAPGQPVDLTYAAEKSLPSVVHILCTRNSKVETVEMQSNPFDDFFSDPFGFSETQIKAMEESRNVSIAHPSSKVLDRA